MQESFQHAITAVQRGELLSGTFATGFCGPQSAFRQVVETAFRQSVSESAKLREFLQGPTGLAALDAKLKTAQPRGDASVPHRWAAMSAIARAVLADLKSSAGCSLLKEAQGHFRSVNQQLGITDAVGSEPTGDPLFKEVGAALQPWTAASWMVWDALTQLQGTKPKATETTWLLSAPVVGIEGLAFRLVVEAVQGPAGLVVPNWWKIGLLPFPTTDQTRQFVPAVQQAMSWVAAEHPDYRLRWHLEPPDSGQWWTGLSGRSGMTAAAVVARAVFQRITEKLPVDAESVLDPHSAVTAELDAGQAGDLNSRQLRMVNATTLGAKFTASQRAGIDTVLIAKDQPIPPNTTPAGMTPADLPNFQEAYDRMLSVERCFDAYREASHQGFEYHQPNPSSER